MTWILSHPLHLNSFVLSLNSSGVIENVSDLTANVKYRDKVENKTTYISNSSNMHNTLLPKVFAHPYK